MALYPTLTEAPFISIKGSMDQKVLFTNFDGLGKEQRKRKWLYPKRSFELSYSVITDVELLTLTQFYNDRDGSYNSFTFIFPSTYSETYTNEYVGSGDGSTTIYNMPCVSESRTVYVDGNEQTEAADATSSGNYYILEAQGQDGVDSLHLNFTPTSSQRITCDFTGRLAARCRFDGTIDFNRQKYSFGFNSANTKLKGLLMDE